MFTVPNPPTAGTADGDILGRCVCKKQKISIRTKKSNSDFTLSHFRLSKEDEYKIWVYSEFWNRLGGQALVTIGQCCARQPLTSHN